MFQKIKQYFFPCTTFFLTLASALFWVALRVNYSGISKFLGADTNQSFLIMNLPVMVCVLAWVGVLLAVLGIFASGKWDWPWLAAFVIGAITAAGAVIVVLFGAKDYLRFISVHFWNSVAVAGAILAFGAVLFCPVKNNTLTVTVKTLLVLLVTAGAVILGYTLRPCDFTYGAVVYGVEDDYQIVFSTSDSAVAWVTVGEENYYDLYAGSMRSADRVHKVTVPQAVLDAAGGYTVHAQQMIYRGPFGGYKGQTISQSYRFRPVSREGGLNYYALSDVHEAVDAAVCAATSRKDTDFLILLGDLVSMVETEKDAQLANALAHGITKGEYPVIYARGNHEIKGEYAEVLYKYVGSKNQSFTYPVTLGGEVFAVVLDMGEDHEDDWWEYYGTAKFDLYREQQSQMMEQILLSGDHMAYPYRMALCHIPVTFVEKDGLFESFRLAWTELLNDLEVDVCLSGHMHEMWQMLPGAVEPHTNLIYAEGFSGTSGKSAEGYVTNHEFPAFLAGRRSLELTGKTQKDGSDQYVCLAARVDFANGRQLFNYVNSRQEIPTGYYPFVGNYPHATFSDIVTDLKRPEKEVANLGEIG